MPDQEARLTTIAKLRLIQNDLKDIWPTIQTTMNTPSTRDECNTLNMVIGLVMRGNKLTGVSNIRLKANVIVNTISLLDKLADIWHVNNDVCEFFPLEWLKQSIELKTNTVVLGVESKYSTFVLTTSLITMVDDTGPGLATIISIFLPQAVYKAMCFCEQVADELEIN